MVIQLLILRSPYKKNDGTVIEFENVQISVDSTGRANQLVRRIETRLDPADIFFPYPQYEVELSGDDNNSLRKNFGLPKIVGPKMALAIITDSCKL